MSVYTYYNVELVYVARRDIYENIVGSELDNNKLYGGLRNLDDYFGSSLEVVCGTDVIVANLHSNYDAVHYAAELVNLPNKWEIFKNSVEDDIFDDNEFFESFKLHGELVAFITRHEVGFPIFMKAINGRHPDDFIPMSGENLPYTIVTTRNIQEHPTLWGLKQLTKTVTLPNCTYTDLPRLIYESRPPVQTAFTTLRYHNGDISVGGTTIMLVDEEND